MAQENNLEIVDKLNELPSTQERVITIAIESDPLSKCLGELRNVLYELEKENIHTLYQTVLPLSTLLNNISVSEAANLPLHTYFINKLSEKEPLLNLLPEVGYMSTNGGPYEYHAPVNASQENKRKILIDEIQQFCEDLKNLKD
ncbi:unnamed protein product, partial [Didymodactylos carnosus]